MIQVPDHPVITAMERYGDTQQPKVAHQCSVCEEPIYQGEMAFDIPCFGWVCEHCADRCYKEAD